MANRRTTVGKLLFTLTGWLSSVLPNTWSVVLTTAGTTAILWMSEGARFFTSPEVLGTIFFATLLLWTLIGLVWLSTRRQRDVRLLRWGITFEGVDPIFTPANREMALGFIIKMRNYTPVPLAYVIEDIDVYLETRSLPSRAPAGSLQGVLPRGAGRGSTAVPFRLEHIQEFFGRRAEGQVNFALTYGDADKPPVRRLTMSIGIVIELPILPIHAAESLLGPLPLLTVGFAGNIISERDEPL